MRFYQSCIEKRVATATQNLVVLTRTLAARLLTFPSLALSPQPDVIRGPFTKSGLVRGIILCKLNFMPHSTRHAPLQRWFGVHTVRATLSASWRSSTSTSDNDTPVGTASNAKERNSRVSKPGWDRQDLGWQKLSDSMQRGATRTSKDACGKARTLDWCQ